MQEITAKLNALRSLAASHSLDAILLQHVSSIAWATSGASSYVNTASSKAELSLLVTNDNHYLVTNNIEAPRLEKEENLASQGWNFQLSPWYQDGHNIDRLIKGRKLGADVVYPGAVDLSQPMARIRANLSQMEGDRFRILGKLCAQVMDAAVRAVRPGQTEFEIAGLLAGEAEQRGVQAIVILVAVDERIYNFRHPLPTSKRLDRYAMLILCGRRWGLVCSLTRLVHFGKLPEEILRKAEAVARVDASMIAATLPGDTLGGVFSCAQQAYAAEGYEGEWRLHHQGGTAGYEPREYLATPDSIDPILAGQVYAWNPSITGCKSEDSIMVKADGFEVLTAIPGWPVYKIKLAGQIIERPAILVVD
jgi:Xaa-Pro aminopeptidase